MLRNIAAYSRATLDQLERAIQVLGRQFGHDLGRRLRAGKAAASHSATVNGDHGRSWPSSTLPAVCHDGRSRVYRDGVRCVFRGRLVSGAKRELTPGSATHQDDPNRV